MFPTMHDGTMLEAFIPGGEAVYCLEGGGYMESTKLRAEVPTFHISSIDLEVVPQTERSLYGLPTIQLIVYCL